MRLILGVIRALLGRWIDIVLGGLKVEAAAVYVAGVRKARQAFIALLGLALSLLLALSGFVFIHVALLAWLPWSLAAKSLVLLALGVVYLGGGFVLVLRLSSDQTWMKFAKVDSILARLPPKR
jgi:cytochrome b subunit of formate dehydrogenase